MCSNAEGQGWMDGVQQDDFMGICSMSIGHLVTECTKACWEHLQKHKKIPESLNGVIFCWVFFVVIILFVGFDCMEYSVHGLRCVSGSSVCRAVLWALRAC